MIKQYSFLNESLKKVVRRLSKLSPENARKAGKDYILSRTKTSNIDDAATKYASGMYKGIENRLNRTASKFNRKLVTIKHDDSNLSGVQFGRPFTSNPDIVAIPKQDNTIFPRSLNWSKDRRFGITKRAVKKSEKELRKPTINKSLTNALVANHELDEYEQALRLAAKNNLDPFVAQHLSTGKMKRMRTTGSHMTGVLDKELERNKLMSQLFGRDKFIITPRTNKEVAVNSRPFKPVKI